MLKTKIKNLQNGFNTRLEPAEESVKLKTGHGSKDRDHPGQQGETPSLLKIQKISWAWWCAPVVPATWEEIGRAHV